MSLAMNKRRDVQPGDSMHGSLPGRSQAASDIVTGVASPWIAIRPAGSFSPAQGASGNRTVNVAP